MFGPPTQSLLFDWEKDFKNEQNFEFRIVESEQLVRPSLSMYSRLPYDLVDLSSQQKIDEWIADQMQKIQKEENNTKWLNS